MHLRADVPVGSYIPAAIDSSLMAILPAKVDPQNRQSFHGRFTEYPGYDESAIARLAAAQSRRAKLNVDRYHRGHFRDHIEKVI